MIICAIVLLLLSKEYYYCLLFLVIGDNLEEDIVKVTEGNKLNDT
jgi:hypothetical protein